MPLIKRRSFSEYADVFFWNFKRMDNANYNFTVLEVLCKSKKEKSNDPHFNKPIFMQIVSIAECILYDLIRRLTEHSHEKIPGIDLAAISDSKAKILDKFDAIIGHIKKHDYLCAITSNLYKDLDDLRLLRNRMHIQNYPPRLDADEPNLWTHKNIVFSGQVLVEIVAVLNSRYPRPGRAVIPMSEFPRPWK